MQHFAQRDIYTNPHTIASPDPTDRKARRENRRIANLFYRFGKRCTREARQAMYGNASARKAAQAASWRRPPPLPPPRRRQCPQVHRATSATGGDDDAA